MAKKKTAEKAKIEATPVLRSQGEEHKTKSYAVRDDWKDTGIVNYVAFKSVDGEVQDLLINGEPAGGGGGGDLTTCEVVIIDNTADGVTLAMPYLYTNSTINKPVVTVSFAPDEGTNRAKSVVLFQGAAVITGATPTAVSGSATIVSGIVEVTGDCTITYE